MFGLVLESAVLLISAVLNYQNDAGFVSVLCCIDRTVVLVISYSVHCVFLC